MIKQEIPQGWIKAQSRFIILEFTTIPHKQIITDWLWRNQHAEPIFTTIIPDDPNYRFRDKCIADYEKRGRKPFI